MAYLRGVSCVVFCAAAVLACAASCVAEKGNSSAVRDDLAPGRVSATLTERPWESKALIPVKLSVIDGLAPLVLAENGAAKAVIVPAAGMPYYREVAEFLADYLKLATGVEFAIAAKPPEGGEAIFVGPVNAAGTAKILERAKALEPEHFIVERVPGGVILVGNDSYRAIDTGKPLTIKTVPFAFGMLFCSKGSYFAAVDFLERFVGVRWYFLGPLGTSVPDRKGKRLAMPSVAYEDGPLFKDRRVFGVYVDEADKGTATGMEVKPYNKYYTLNEFRVWGNRNGAMWPGKAQHTDCDWHKLYGKEHPEYFALRADGTRMVGEEGKEIFSAQRCYTNEAGFQQHLRNIERYLASGEGAEAFTDRLGECLPNKDFVYWAPNDGFTGCACPGCLALIDTNASPETRNARLIWEYVAKLAAAIKQKWPGKKLCVFGAYQGDATIPEGVILPGNVVITLTIASAPECYMKEPVYRTANQELVDYFYGKTGKVLIWTYPNEPYYSQRMLYPTFAPHSQADFIRTNRDKITGVFTQECYPLNALNSALYAKLLWNPDIDVDAFLAEYPAAMFGPAAPRMKELLDLCVSRWEDTRWSYLPPPSRLERAIPEQMVWKESYPREIRDRMQDLLRQALAAVPEEGIYRQRVQYTAAYMAPFFDAGKFADETVKPVVDCAKAATPIVVDGDLGEWGASRHVELKGWKGEAVKERTEMLVARNDAAVCVAGRVHESEGLVLPKAPKDAAIFNYDSVELYFCPEQVGLEEAGMAKSEQFFQIILNARGDTAVYRKKLERTKAEAVDKLDFTSAVKPMDKGFQFEIRIPYASLGAPTPKEGRSEWLANFYRSRPRGEDKGYQAWSPTMGKSFFDTRCFGILRFATAPLFEIDFAKAAISIQDWSEAPVPKDASWSLKDGKLVVSVKALPALASEASASVYFDKIPKLPLDKPAKVEWAFRHKGVGLKSVTMCLKSSYDQDKKRAVASKVLQIVPVADHGMSDWQRGAMRIPDGAVKLDDISYWDLSLRFAPGADFVFELDYVKVLPEE